MHIGVLYGLYRDNGKENGYYYIIMVYILGFYWGYIGIMEKEIGNSIRIYWGILGVSFSGVHSSGLRRENDELGYVVHQPVHP